MWTRLAFTASGRSQGCVCACVCVCNKLNRFFKDVLKSQKEFKVRWAKKMEWAFQKTRVFCRRTCEKNVLSHCDVKVLTVSKDAI